MAGIYIHVPFCRKACHYCNFHFSVSLNNKNGFVTALLEEMRLQQGYLQGETIHTIYFGGGTPSLLETDTIARLLNELGRWYKVSPQAEITLEANPDDIDARSLSEWRRAGINRLSIGIQSFREEDLQKWMNRAHTAAQASNCIQLAREAGFRNFSIDLIYGGPLLTDEQWEANVKQALDMDIPHLSCYALTVEPGTALQHMIAHKKKEPVDPEKQARHFQQLMEWMKAAGYEHYEISNFARPGMQSRHNQSYWQGQYYLGLGPSAHSFNGHSRQWNVANNVQYIAALEKNQLAFEMETLTKVQRLNEYIMTSLRTQEGLDLDHIRSAFGTHPADQLEQQATRFAALERLERKGNSLVLTNEGKLFADGIAADLFFTEEEAVNAGMLL